MLMPFGLFGSEYSPSLPRNIAEQCLYLVAKDFDDMNILKRFIQFSGLFWLY